jgi:hypothetical protein
MEIDSAQNSEITLTQEIEFSTQEIKLKSKIISIDFMALSKTLVLSFDDGSVVFATLASFTQSNSYWELPKLEKWTTKNNRFNQLDSSGKKFSRFIELTQSTSEKSLTMLGVYHKEETSIGVIIKLTQNRVAVTPVWSSANTPGPVSALQGFVVIRAKPTSKQPHVLRLLTFHSNGQAHAHQYELSSVGQRGPFIDSMKNDSKKF